MVGPSYDNTDWIDRMKQRLDVYALIGAERYPMGGEAEARCVRCEGNDEHCKECRRGGE